MSLSLSLLCVAVAVVVVCVCVVWCGVVWCGVVWCGVWSDTLKNFVCTFKTSPVSSTCANTCGRGAGTHEDVLNVHTERRERWAIVSSAYQNVPTLGYHVLQRFNKETHVTNFEFEKKKSRTTRCRVLHLFASPVNTVQLRTHDTTTTTDTHNNDNNTQQHTTTQHRTRYSAEAKRRRRETVMKRDTNEKREEGKREERD